MLFSRFCSQKSWLAETSRLNLLLVSVIPIFMKVQRQFMTAFSSKVPEIATARSIDRH